MVRWGRIPCCPQALPGFSHLSTCSPPKVEVSTSAKYFAVEPQPEVAADGGGGFGGDDADYDDGGGGGGGAVTGQTTAEVEPAELAAGRDADCSTPDDLPLRGTSWTWQSGSSLALPLHCRNIESRGH